MNNSAIIGIAKALSAQGGGSGVTDVMVNGTSVVSDGVASISIPETKKLIIDFSDSENITANMEYDDVYDAISGGGFECFGKNGSGYTGAALVAMAELYGHKMMVFRIEASGMDIPPVPMYLQYTDGVWSDITPA